MTCITHKHAGMAFCHQTDSNFHIPVPHSTSCEVKEVCPHIAQVCPLLVPSVCVHVILTSFEVAAGFYFGFHQSSVKIQSIFAGHTVCK